MALDIRVLTGETLATAIPDVARLRIAVFREWPYLYDGDLEYEARYLEPYVSTEQSVLVGAFDGSQLVGASTAMPLTAHSDDFGAAFASSALQIEDVFYCAESVLLPDYRGQGAGHAFFDLREAVALTHGFRHSAFCSVIRPPDHPARPTAYRPLDTFWRTRGYAPLSGVVASFNWRDIGQAEESPKPLQFWARTL
jgi:GNAT superfamily N-acetyltransferase